MSVLSDAYLIAVFNESDLTHKNKLRNLVRNNIFNM